MAVGVEELGGRKTSTPLILDTHPLALQPTPNLHDATPYTLPSSRKRAHSTRPLETALKLTLFSRRLLSPTPALGGTRTPLDSFLDAWQRG